MEKLLFVRNNIERINSPKFKEYFNKISEEDRPFSSYTELENYLSQKHNDEFIDVKDKIFEEWKNLDYTKSKIEDLANKYVVRKGDLTKSLLVMVGEKLNQELNEGRFDDLIETFVERIKIRFEKETGFKAIQSDYKKVLKNNLLFTNQRGFPENILKINSGVMTANAGDSHQFLFLSRAILAGYNCSNVDVRSSGYDAIIDHKGKLFKVQIKGISTGTSTISFQDRARGGQGIDHKHERNIGKVITKEDCDIYVAVEKNTGICYLIPMEYIDSLNLPNHKIHKDDLEYYRENWEVLDAL